MRTGILALTLLLSFTRVAEAATTIRIIPPDAGPFAAGQRFDIRVEAQSDGAARFSGVYENTDVILKTLRAMTASYSR